MAVPFSPSLGAGVSQGAGGVPGGVARVAIDVGIIGIADQQRGLLANSV